MADPALVPWALSALFNHRAVASEAAGGTVFVFPGRGSRWIDMAIDLMTSAPAFADEMSACDAAFREQTDRSLLGAIADGPESRKWFDMSQSLSFAVMVSVAAHWRQLGVHPDAVLGHSHGEIAAAYVAGALALPDAVNVVVQRGSAVNAAASTSGMVAIGWPVERVLAFAERWDQSVSVAAYNGPSSTVVTGSAAAIGELVAAATRDDVQVARMPAEFALQSPQLEALRPVLRESLADVRPRSTDVTFISSVTGAALDTAILDADYWFANLAQPVLFEQAVQWSHQHGYHTFTEVSPDPELIGDIRQSLNDHSIRAPVEAR
jgi:polyketide synthase 12